MPKVQTLLVQLFCFACVVHAQTSTVPEHGIRDRFPTTVAITGARIVREPGQVVEGGSMLIEDGIIKAIGTIEVPAHARQVDLTGKTVYPALIEPYHEIEVAPKRSSASHWNKQVHPEWSIASDWTSDQNVNKSMRDAGFAIGLLVPKAGVLKGSSIAVSFGDRPSAESIVREEVAHHIRLTCSRSREDYPGSPMGAVALARQTFYDAEWYAKAWRTFRAGGNVARPETNDALKTLARALANDELFVFDALDEQYALRANRFAVEFGLNRIALRGSGREYQRLDAIVEPRHTIILPIDFPKPPNVATPEAARNASLAELMHWHFAPENPARLRDAGANIVFTSHGLKNKADFLTRLRTATERGLDAEDALYGCTMGPAKLLGIESQAGSLAAGKAANLMVCDGDWWNEKTGIVETWVDGKRFEHKPKSVDDLDGIWKLRIETSAPEQQTLYLNIKQDEESKLSGSVSTEKPAREETDDAETNEHKDEDHHHDGGDEASGKEEQDNEPKTKTKLEGLSTSYGRMSASFSSEIWGTKKTIRFSATLLDDGELIGRLIDGVGHELALSGKRLDEEPDDESQEEAGDEQGSDRETSDKGDKGDKDEQQEGETHEQPPIRVNYPLGAYGVSVPNRAANAVLIENATIWTCGPHGILKNASVFIKDGSIQAVGKDLNAPKGVQRINAKGKHITPGIIDCHSHMATDGGVNESTQAITAEVRIGDFIDATDISIYRQLAGGVTTANILHGSANPIGGQNQVIKLRWGKLPDEMKFKEAPPGIKFALGENVKQSNWGDDFRTRYPQSRLGVEQIMRDAFLAAKAYEKRWQDWKAKGIGLPPRRDLELDAILQIVNRERWIHCHSYRQDEILALIRTLDDFDITIGTFQHILEGYKVAKEMAEHGAMGSSFSDWWAYKFEVYDAIPYNGALMHNAGIVVSFNSDDAELARHLNHEAAKAVKYGGISREEALNFVTINPAKQLRIDQHVGSVEVGKDADLVVWSGDPLQVTSRCEQTWIDGVRFFDIELEQTIRKDEAVLKARLVRMILDSGQSMKKPGEEARLWRDLFPRHDEYCGHGHGH